MTNVLICVGVGVAELASIACAVVLWRQRASVARRLLWTPVVLFPVFGPLFFAGLFDVPSRQPEAEQASRTSGDDAGPFGP